MIYQLISPPDELIDKLEARDYYCTKLDLNTWKVEVPEEYSDVIEDLMDVYRNINKKFSYSRI